MKNILANIIYKLGYEIRRKNKNNSNNNFNEYLQMKKILYNCHEPIIFDVGAFKGKMIKQYRSHFPKSKIFAFEPIPECFEIIKKMTLTDLNLQAYCYALNSNNNIKKFYLNNNLASSSLLKSNINGQKIWGNDILKTISNIQVECKTIDHFCNENNINHINILKLDVQGSELDVLEGATNLLKKGRIDIIFSEISIFSSYEKQGDLNQIISFLYKNNFELFNIYKSIRKNGQLLEIDAMFINNKLNYYHY